MMILFPRIGVKYLYQRERSIPPKTFSQWLGRVAALIVSLLFSYLTVTPAYGQEPVGLGEVTPLKIGDTIPEELWDLEIPVLSHNGNKSTLTLRDYSDGVIILDFWGTWCSNCISEFPKLFDLQDKFAEEKILLLPVAKQKEEIITRVMETTIIKDILNFQTANDNGYLFDLFPAQGYPHVVIIKGKSVFAITNSKSINDQTVGELISGKVGYIPTKRDTRDLISKSLLIPRFLDIRQDHPIYYSTLMRQQDGLNPRIVFDRTTERTRWLIPNYNLWFIYELAWGYKEDERIFEISNFPNRRIVLTNNPALHFDQRESQGYSNADSDEFLRSHNYTYDLWMPPSLTKEDARKKLTQDVDCYLGVTTAVKTINMPCYVLKETETDVAKNHEIVEEMRTDRLIRYLNSPTFGLPPIVTDISSYNAPKVELEKKYYSFEELNNALHSYNLKIVRESRLIEMFVVKDTKFTTAVDVNALELTHYGFINKSKL